MLAFDVEKNLRAPLAGMTLAAERLGEAVSTPEGRDAHWRHPVVGPPEVDAQAARLLITTPECLYLMLTSSGGRDAAGVETVIIDEIHALAPDQARRTPLAVARAARSELTDPRPQRIGLSATQRPLDEIARFLGGHAATGRRGR